MSLFRRLGLAVRLLKLCPFDEVHFFWERLCTCGFGVLIEDSEHPWHGGVYDLDADVELQICEECHSDWALDESIADEDYVEETLSPEEAYLVDAWRQYRHEMLDAYGDHTPYECKVIVDLNGRQDPLLHRIQGAAIMADDGLFGTSRNRKIKPS